jgi:hypothetical protein
VQASPLLSKVSVLLFQTPLTSVHYQSTTYGVLQSLQSSTSVLLWVFGFFLGSEEKTATKHLKFNPHLYN